MLGPLHPIEGFVPLLKAFAEVGHDADGWGVVLAGRETGDWRKILEAAIRRKGEEDRVVITTAPDVATQQAWLARATVLAAPSLQVRCPVSVLQAVAAGVPVLASSYVTPGGLEDVIRVCGTSRQDLKAALRWVVSLSDSDRIEFGRRAGEVGRAAFDWSVLVEEYIRLYRNLV
jgi:glycosyltransferase involved in cell wall biosynthesis